MRLFRFRSGRRKVDFVAEDTWADLYALEMTG